MKKSIKILTTGVVALSSEGLSMNKYLIILAALLFVGQSSNAQPTKLTQDFVSDSLGCLGLRAKYVIVKDSIFKSFIKGKTRDEIIGLLGKPNSYWRNAKSFKAAPRNLKWDKFVYLTDCKKNNILYVMFDRISGKAMGLNYHSE